MSARKPARRRRPVPVSDLSPLASAMRNVSIASRHPRLRLDRRAVARVIHLLDAEFPNSQIPSGELSLVFLTDAALAQLHDQFLDDPAATDVITFDGVAELGTAGEICVSADAALRHLASLARHRPAADFSAELTLYLVHGWLHLAGYDDLVPEKKRAMRRAEARAMRLLARAGAVPKFTLRPARGRTPPL